MMDLLLTRAAAAGIPLTRAQAQQLCAYHALLTGANARFNLTRVGDDPAEAIDRNYLDSLAPLKWGLPDGVRRAIDVGSGAGFPGIPLSICLPEVEFVLLDSLAKRVDFLNDVIGRLGLNARAVHLRAEDAGKSPAYRETFDLATARAVAALNLLAEYLLPFVRVGGHMLCYKGPALDQEIAGAQYALKLLGGRLAQSRRVDLPGRDWDHRLCWIEKCAPTPGRFPRKAGKPAAAPLCAPEK